MAKFDLHLHSNYSDGSATVKELVDTVVQSGIKIFALTDHDTVAGVNEAAKYVPLDRLCLSPQCGFASCEIGNKLTEEEQWAKLELVKEIAEEVWG